MDSRSLYWLGRMIVAGEDPRYVARRMIRFASEDVGMADPLVQRAVAWGCMHDASLSCCAGVQALPQAIAAAQSVQLVGMPECNVMLAQCAVYLAKAPKSIAVYEAYKKYVLVGPVLHILSWLVRGAQAIAPARVEHTIKTSPAVPVPLHLRNAPTKLMKNIGYGKGYVYPPSSTAALAAMQSYLPDDLSCKQFYSEPASRKPTVRTGSR